MEARQPRNPALPLVASASLSLGFGALPGCSSAYGVAEAVAGPSRQPTVCSSSAARPSGSGGSKRSARGSSGSSSSGAGGNGGARSNFTSRALRFGAGAGGGMAAYFGGGGLAHAHPLWQLRPAANAPRRKKDGKTRVLILMSDTGGGHRASAEALKAGFEELYGARYHVDVLDIWAHHTPYPFNQMPKTYSFLVKYPFLWRAAFNAWQPRLVHVPCSTMSAAMVGQRVSEAFDLYQPDLVVSVHPLMQHVPLRIMRMRIAAGMQPPTAFATVVTDLTTCHNTWFHAGVDRCYVATEPSMQQALGLGMAAQQMRLYGLPIRPAFGRKFPAQSKLRKQLGMVQDKPAILLVGGGEGMGPVEATVDGLAQHIGAGCQVVVICGRNARLVERLQAKRYPEGMHVVVQGFVTNMPEFMAASDVIITKAGPGTIMEALICGLPLVLNAYVPCQEEGNIPFVVDNQVGVFEKRPERIARTIQAWLSPENKEQWAAMKARAKALGKPNALFDICRDLNSLEQGAKGGAGVPTLAAA